MLPATWRQIGPQTNQAVARDIIPARNQAASLAEDPLPEDGRESVPVQVS